MASPRRATHSEAPTETYLRLATTSKAAKVAQGLVSGRYLVGEAGSSPGHRWVVPSAALDDELVIVEPEGEESASTEHALGGLVLALEGGAITSAVSEAALRSFLRAVEHSGADIELVLDSVASALEQAPKGGALTQGEADFVEKFGGLSDSGGERFSELIAAQAAKDARAFLGTEEVASLLGISDSRVRHRRLAGDIIAYRSGRDLRFPRWQFAPTGKGTQMLPHATQVAKAAESMHPAELAGRMTTPQRSLILNGNPVTPAQWLAEGGPIEHAVETILDDQAW